jgi:probable addiction module antidote protein
MARGSKFRDDLEKKLQNPKFAANYLASAIEENDDAFLSEALATVVKVHGPSQISEEAGISRQALHKMLSTSGNPSFKNISKLLEALGLELTVRKKKKAS